LDPGFLSKRDDAITLCAEQPCPALPSPAKRLHWPVEDPASPAPSAEVEAERYRQAREQIRSLLERFARQHNITISDGYDTKQR